MFSDAMPQIAREAWYSTLAALVLGTALLVLLLDRGAPPSLHESPTVPSPSAGTERGSAAAASVEQSDADPEHGTGGGVTRTGEPPPPPRRASYYIAALGDSLTDPKSHGGKYLDYVKARCPETRIDNFGRGADMVNQMRRRFLNDILPSPNRYTHLIVFGGVNDLYSDQTAGRTPEKVARDLLDVYTRARQRGMKIVALTVAPWGGFKRYYNSKRGADTHRLNQWIRGQLDAGTAEHVVDAYALLSCGYPELLCGDYSIDGIHFNAKGHAVLGKALHEDAFADCK